MDFEFSKNSPEPIDEKKYREQVMIDFRKLLESNSDNEKVFQNFLEQTPCLVPGAKSAFGMHPSGHGPLYNALLTQPKISGLKSRNPDFLWLSYDSSVFSPVFIEIEAPNKKYYRKGNDRTTPEFEEAKNQLIEWKTIFSIPINIQKFISDYNIPNDPAELSFQPYYLLIYGRRNEFENNRWQKQKRAQLLGDSRDMILMSYDRLAPEHVHKNFITCEVKGGEYYAKYLTPTFKVGPFSHELEKIKNVIEAADKMSYTTDERKVFLKTRISYWLNYLKKQTDQSSMFTFSLGDLQKWTKTEE